MRRKRKSSHAVYDLRVHLVWVTKYRYKVLIGKIAQRVRELVRQTCDSKDIHIIRGHISADHIHLYISYPPLFSVSELIKAIKGRVSRKIQQEFPELGKRYWGKHFWAIGYAAFSAGEVTDQVVREYVANHSEDDDGSFTDVGGPQIQRAFSSNSQVLNLFQYKKNPAGSFRCPRACAVPSIT